MNQKAVDKLVKWLTDNSSMLGDLLSQEAQGSSSAEREQSQKKSMQTFARIEKELSPLLAAVGDGLTFETGPGKSKPGALIISGGGLKANIPVVRHIVESIPEGLPFEVQAFKPARGITESSTLTQQGKNTTQSIEPRDIRFSLERDLLKIHVNLFFKNYTEAERRNFMIIGFHFLDFALGEYDVMSCVGAVEVGPYPQSQADTECITELSKTFEIEKSKILDSFQELFTAKPEVKIADAQVRLADELKALKVTIAETREEQDFYVAVRLWSKTEDLLSQVALRLPNFECSSEESLTVLGEGFELLFYGPVKNTSPDLDQWLEENLTPLLAYDCLLIGIGEAIGPSLMEGLMVGYGYFQEKHYVEAIKILEFVLSQHADEDDGSAHNLLALCYLDSGDNENAIRINRKVIEIAAEQSLLHDAYANTGLALIRIKRLDEAIEWLNKAIALRPSNANSYHNLACCYGLKGEAEPACLNIEKAVKYEPARLAQIIKDFDFDSIRETEGFQSTIANLQQKKSSVSGFVKKLFGR